MSWKSKGAFLRRTDVRLTLWHSSFLLAVLALTCLFLGYRLHRHLLKQADAMLMDEAQEIRALLGQDPTLGWVEKFKTELGGRTKHKIRFRLLGKEGEELASMGQENFPWSAVRLDPESKIPRNFRFFRSLEWRGVSHRELTIHMKGPNGPLVLQLSTELKELRNAMGNFYRNVLILIPGALVLCGAGGWFLARRSLAPIRKIAATASRISSEDLSQRLVPRGTGDELDELMEIMNGMLDRLQRSFEELRRFSADVAHELRTPICAMRGEAELALSRPRSQRQYREVLERFAEQFDRLNALVNDLLLLAKFEGGGASLVMEPLDLGQLLGNLAELFEPLAEQKGIELRLDPLGGIGVRGEKALLQQALSNLIHNAIQYTQEGGSVRLKVTEEDGWAKILVEDTGLGIPEEEIPRVFERFYRVEGSRSRQTGGAGLGLSIARRILEVHGGTIRLRSQVGVGTVVEVRLPELGR